METKEYLKKAEKIYKEEGISKVEEFFKENKDQELERIIKLKGFNKSSYLSDETKFIIEKTGLKELEKIIHTFCYAVNDFRRKQEKKEEEDKIREEAIKNGFKEQDILNKDELKKLSGSKVFCIFDRDRIGLLGSFTKKEEREGKLHFDEQQNSLFFLPKRHTRTGQILRDKFYYKELKK